MTHIATETIAPLWEKMLHSVDEEGTIVLTTNDVPVAEVHLFPQYGKKLRPFGLAKGQFVVPDDFDDPLPEDILNLFEGKEDEPTT